MKNVELSFRDELNIPGFVGALHAEVEGFRKKSSALSVASQFGWGSKVLRVETRFEVLWYVGCKDMQPDEVFGAVADVFRFPTLRYEFINGVKQQPVLKVRRFRESQPGGSYA